MYLTPPFSSGGVKYIDELTNGATNGSVKSFDQLIDDLWCLLRMMLDGVKKKWGLPVAVQPSDCTGTKHVRHYKCLFE
jgi:hypothetical protein